MKKQQIVVIIVVAGLIVLSVAGYAVWQELQKETIYIAVAGPMSGEYESDGESMLTGVRLSLKQLNKSGGLPGKRIKIIPVDDQNDTDVAMQVAERLAQENKVLLVIGHLYSSTSLAAGKVYRKYEIPVITGSATAEDVTRGNPWSFRVIPNNMFQGMFVANYLKYALHINTASVIALDNAYGQSLYNAFRTTASQIGLQMLNHWTLSEDGYSDDDIARIVKGLGTSQTSGAIFLAAYGITDDARLIVALREAGIHSLLIGSESFADPVYFNEQFEGLPEAQHPPTYYTNGMYTVSLFMQEIIGKEGFDFLHAYTAEYPTESLFWNTPCYYDAMRVAIEAITRANLKGQKYIRHDRKQVRDTLASLYAPPTHSVKGVSGEIFFDADRNANRPLAMSIYHDDQLLPAFTQYQQLSNLDRFTDRVQSALNGELMMITDHFLTRTEVVRAGMQVHEVRQFDPENTQYTLDFSLWLRFPEELNPAALLFLNAVTPIHLGEPVLAETVDGITTQIFHLEGNFTNVIDFRHYPFDRQVLTITFRHASRMLEELIFVPDRSGMPEFLQQTDAPPKLPAKWLLKTTDTYQNVAQHAMPLTTTPYSEFHFDLRVARQDLPLLIGHLALLLIICVLFGVMLALPEDWILERLLLGAGILIGALIVQFALGPGGHVTYILDVEYVVLGLYILAVLGIFGAVSAYYFYYARLSIIRRIPLFASLSHADQSSLSKKMKRYHYRKPDKTIIRQGDPGDSLFLIVDGEIAFWVRDESGHSHEVNHFSDGQFFGEMALLTGKPRTATAVTVMPTRIGEINRQHLIPLFRKRPDLIEIMANEMAGLDIKFAQRRNPEQTQQLNQAVLTRQYTETIIQQLDLA